VASSDSASSAVATAAARPEKGACSSLTARSLALVTTGANAIRAKSRAAASGPMSKLPTDTIRRSSATTTGLDCQELSSSWRIMPT
jgi:hypothetical protein